jgi:hypothetical protein
MRLACNAPMPAIRIQRHGSGSHDPFDRQDTGKSERYRKSEVRWRTTLRVAHLLRRPLAGPENPPYAFGGVACEAASNCLSPCCRQRRLPANTRSPPHPARPAHRRSTASRARASAESRAQLDSDPGTQRGSPQRPTGLEPSRARARAESLSYAFTSRIEPNSNEPGSTRATRAAEPGSARSNRVSTRTTQPSAQLSTDPARARVSTRAEHDRPS